MVGEPPPVGDPTHRRVGRRARLQVAVGPVQPDPAQVLQRSDVVMAAEDQLQGPGAQARGGGDVGQRDVVRRMIVDVADRPAQRRRLDPARRRRPSARPRGSGTTPPASPTRLRNTAVRVSGPAMISPSPSTSRRRCATVARQCAARAGDTARHRSTGSVGASNPVSSATTRATATGSSRTTSTSSRGEKIRRSVAASQSRTSPGPARSSSRRLVRRSSPVSGWTTTSDSAGPNRLSTAVAWRTCSTANRFVATPSYSRWKPARFVSERCRVCGP